MLRHMRKTIGIMALLGSAALSAGGCRNDTVNNPPAPVKDMSGIAPADLTGVAPADLSGVPTADLSGKGYVTATVANMRQGKSGQFEFDNVVTISPPAGGNTLNLFVQDAAGGDFSAMRVTCESQGKTHLCPMPAYMTMKTLAQGHSVTIQGTYIKSAAGAMVKAENFYIDSITDNGNASLPAATVLTLADISRTAMKAANWFQLVKVTLADKLVPFDLSPLEFAYNNAPGCAKCPCQFGFGMIPAAAMAKVAPACSGKTQPAAQTALPTEVFIGTDFYKSFPISSDCPCSAGYSDFQVAPTNFIASGATISGILVFDSVYNTTNYYQYLAPIQVMGVAADGGGTPSAPFTGDFPLQ